MTMGKSDVDARVIDYFKTFNKITLDNGLSDYFTQSDGASVKLQAPDVCAVTNGAKEGASLPTVEATKEGGYCAHPWRGKAPEVSKQKKRLNTKSVAPATAPAFVGGFAIPKPANPPALKSKAPNPPPGPCPKCRELHWLRECTKTTEAEKVELIKQMREGRKTKKTRLKRLGEVFPSPEQKITLNGVLNLPYCPDGGSDYTAIGRSHSEMLRETDPSVQGKKLAVPVLNLYFGSTRVTTKLKTNLYILTHTAAGPVEPMKAVDVLIVDADDDEFGVGNDLLTTLGINVDR
ncbi:unnamed protein product [Phytophthora fragariaefolia]|uniref:Unnamed protein product n=1 Tax=Phytophthora fragariaefolia TaxID=1490495 RepID=A0A9W7CML8_9STRA|nr:unnamed protein product [Phytophthora fragariaefolia]